MQTGTARHGVGVVPNVGKGTNFFWSDQTRSWVGVESELGRFWALFS